MNEALPERCSHGVRWENRCGDCDAESAALGTPDLIERLRSSPTVMGWARVRLDDLHAALKLLGACGVPACETTQEKDHG